LKRFGNTLIAITGNMTSFLAKADHVLHNCKSRSLPYQSSLYQQHYCPTSYGRCSAVCLMEFVILSPKTIYHPGGRIRQKLLLRVNDMLEHTLKPMVTPMLN
jgi:arabinose-5-phosphate isomerase